MDRRFAVPHAATCRILVGSGLERGLPAVVGALDPDGVVVAFDRAVARIGERIAVALNARAALSIDDAEAQKRLDAVGRLADQLHEAGATRATVLVAVGGGSVTDLVGFVGSIYLRGMPTVFCPTTTLAMCDAAIGGKNGVDHNGLKNRLGTIRQPDAIVCDIDWLRTLPPDLVREGLVEVVKKAFVLDASAFAELEGLAPALAALDPAALTRAVDIAVELKMGVVLADEREAGRRRALNAGHTIGHAIESLAAGAIRHGRAVAIGLVAECRAADVPAAIVDRLLRLLTALGVASDLPRAFADAAALWELARRDKKAVRGSVPMFVPRALGEGVVVELTPESLAQALA
jgi:3-dehydroquinate synthase